MIVFSINVVVQRVEYSDEYGYSLYAVGPLGDMPGSYELKIRQTGQLNIRAGDVLTLAAEPGTHPARP